MISNNTKLKELEGRVLFTQNATREGKYTTVSKGDERFKGFEEPCMFDSLPTHDGYGKPITYSLSCSCPKCTPR